MERVASTEDLIFGNQEGSSWTDWRQWNNRRKIVVGASIFCFFGLLLTIVSVIAVNSHSSAVMPTPTSSTTTPTTTTSTTTEPTTTTTSTTTPTTTTSMTTPTTTTSTTTPTTTTSTTTPTTTTSTTTPTTTTSTTTPTTTTSTTTPTTTTSTTTPTTTTTTTTPTTTTSTTTPTTTTSTTTPTTTTSTTTPTNATTTQPPFLPSTEHPLPVDPTKISAVSLLIQIGVRPNFTEVHCETVTPQTFKFNVTVQGHSWTGESDTKQHAKEASARAAAFQMFHIDYSKSRIIPPPPNPCKFSEIDEGDEEL